MKLPYILYLMLLLAALQACKSGKTPNRAASDAAERLQQIKLTGTTTAKMFYEQLPSASGAEYTSSGLYVLGDDSPYLFQLNESFQVVKKYVLSVDSSGINGGRLPKASKPDLESMAYFKYGRDEMLLLAGSGASTARNRAYLINLSENMAVTPLDLSRLYTFLKRVLKLETNGQLNLEGMAMDGVYTYLLQRPLGINGNTLIRFDTNAFKRFLMYDGDLPAAALYHFDLPKLGQKQAGFSGAYTVGDKLFFTASVEDSPSAVEDGEVLGSYIGMIDLNALPYATNPAKPLAVPTLALNNPNGTGYVGKAESLVVFEGQEPGKYKVIVLSDDDQGHSELLQVQLVIE
ncbi:DUF6929 family protein [Pontibacter oryzae]|uniref:DUF4397 domain-containing protein n=1 Tax=Pontibacter oryzae TaxID=2304593 RepID=A0A399SKV1_9BACT|nr:hypothetical protein [Pontibacter oryzae]RIJ43093.1 hypothetical protein D1627_04495 [Pontibacter oryzae]